MVVAVPAPLVVERDQEQVRPVQLLEHRLAAGLAGHGVAQRAGEPVEDGGLEQEPAHRLGLPVEDLLDEVVHDEPVVAGEPGDERRTASSRPRSDSAASCRAATQPSVRSSSAATSPAAEPARWLVEVAGRLVGGEAEVGRPDLGELAAGTQPGQRQGRVGAGADDQTHLGREVVDQERHPGADPRAVGEVVVVQDQGDLAGQHAELVEHPGQHVLGGLRPAWSSGRVLAPTPGTARSSAVTT